MTSARYRIEVFHRFHDPRREVVRKKLSGLGFAVSAVHISDNYLVSADITGEQAEMVADLLVQPVIEDRLINKPYSPAGFTYAVEIGFLPGVTDNIAHTVRESIEDLLKMRLDIEKSVFSTTTYFFTGDLTPADMESICAELHNPLIQRKKVLSAAEFARQGGLGADLPVVSIAERPEADVVDLSVGEDELLLIGKEGIRDPDGARRGPLALDMLSMKTIRHYFVDMEKRNPTDIELESIAQTWSEHCKHTIFSAELDDDIPEGIFRKYIREATVRVRREKGARDFCVSVFEDNSGGIEFDENYIVSDKVETHNSPSALDPFGGAITGIVGVNRDAIASAWLQSRLPTGTGSALRTPLTAGRSTRARIRRAKCSRPGGYWKAWSTVSTRAAIPRAYPRPRASSISTSGTRANRWSSSGPSACFRKR